VSEFRDWNKKIIDEFRDNEGKVAGPFEGAPMILLHTIGRKSGEPRLNPLVYQKVDDAFAIFGSKGGAPAHPEWYRNLMANPKTTVEVGTESFDVTAREATGEERERIWTEQKKRMPGFADYEKATNRQIPVVVLERMR
jgi:deazaflavin-dependent oxidoreductase (nitroreductase family)